VIGRGVLVSVRDPAEAGDAIAGGAAVIDVKEPAAGSLGAAPAETIAAVAERVDGRVPWTMAAGELAAGLDAIMRLVAAVETLVGPDAPGPAAVKAGLAGMAGRDWRSGLEHLTAALPPDCMHVAVAYADYDRVAAPPPDDVIEVAAAIGCGMLLIDTSDKRGPGLLSTRPCADLARWVARARARGLGVALAGRLALADIPHAARFEPDLVALRSAVCSNRFVAENAGCDPRLGRIDPVLVAAAVEAARPSPAGATP